MTSTRDALAPVRDALLDAARADAAAACARADQEARQILDDATDHANGILAAARARGRAEAAAQLDEGRAQARRRARELELTACREAFDALRGRVADLLRERCAGPNAARATAHLQAAARAHLGDEAALTTADGDGVRGQAPGRFVDASFAVLADRAVEALGQRVEQLWSP